MNKKFYVSRQQPYYASMEAGEAVWQVEIAQGGLDYSGADALTCKYPKLGEGKEFIGMVAAVEAAIAIAKQWSKDSKKNILIACGNTQGIFTELPGDGELMVKARQFDEQLPRCAECGDILVEEYYFHDFDPDIKFCREYCGEEYWSKYQKEMAEEESLAGE